MNEGDGMKDWQPTACLLALAAEAAGRSLFYEARVRAGL